MKVKELINLLKQYDLNSEVFVQEYGLPVAVDSVYWYDDGYGEVDKNTPVIKIGKLGT